MQEALPFKTWLPMQSKDNQLTTSTASSAFKLKGGASGRGDLRNAIKENAVIVIGKQGCCMMHVVKRLLQGLGVNPPVHEVEEEDEGGVVKELGRISSSEGWPVQFPVVFIGGQMFGGLDRIMATHITGELTPILKRAGALWL